MKKLNSHQIAWITVAVIGILASPLIGRLNAQTNAVASLTSQQDQPDQVTDGLTEQELVELQDKIASVVQKVIPATVSVMFYEDPVNMGGGSGVIVSKDGLVLTAGHCVEESGKRFRLIMHDGTEVNAIGLGFAPNIDCGLLQITDEGEWPTAEMGWTCDLNVDDPCISVGHAGGFHENRGVVVRFGRIAEVYSRNLGHTRSTCLMEPGDSGGPLFDIQGRVIGIHSSIEQNLDQNFEVPIDYFRRYWSELNESERFRASGTPAGKQFGLKTLGSRIRIKSSESKQKKGKRIPCVKIRSIADEGWASSIGLKKDDRLVRIGGKKVRTPYQVEGYLFDSLLRKEKQVEIVYWRENKECSLMVDLSSVEPVAASELTRYSAPQVSDYRAISDGFPAILDNIESRLDDSCVLITSAEKNHGDDDQEEADEQEDVDDEQDSSSNQQGMGIALFDDTLDLGARFNGQTLILSKGSILGEQPVVQTEDGQTASAVLVARDFRNDLALLTVDLKIANAVKVSEILDQDAQMELGKFLLTPHPKDSGEISVVGSRAYPSKRKGYLGVQIDFDQEDKVLLKKVYSDSAASRGGLKAGDVIVSINGKELSAPTELVDELGNLQALEFAVMTVTRDDTEFSTRLQLSDKTPGGDLDSGDSYHIADHFEGGKSKIHNGFSEVIAHDARVFPDECGGPIYDLNGAFVGFNAARVSRTHCLMLPAHVIENFLRSVNDGQHGTE